MERNIEFSQIYFTTGISLHTYYKQKVYKATAYSICKLGRALSIRVYVIYIILILRCHLRVSKNPEVF